MMTTQLHLLPSDMLYEIRSRLDSLSNAILDLVLLNKPLPEKFDDQLIDDLVSHGMKLVLYFNRVDLHEQNKIYESAARQGDLEVFIWAHEKRPHSLTFRPSLIAAIEGRLNILEWLNRYPLHYQEIFEAAMEYGRIPVLEWCYQKCYEPPHNIITTAVIYGRLEVVKWLYQRGFRFDSWTAINAAFSGSLELVKWLYDEDCHFDSEICDSAAYSGNAELIEWLHNEGFRLNDQTYYQAVMNGRLEIVKWLRLKGIAYPVDILDHFDKRRFPELAEYLIRQKCPQWETITDEL